VPDGLTAPEAAKNATTGAAMIPLLTLGIPGSAATAIMMAALVLKGVTPGPMLFSTQTDLVYAIFASMLLANIFMIVAGVVIARGFSHFMKVPPAILSGFIVVLSVLGAYGVRNNIFDVYVCMVFGVIGYLMKRYNFPAAPLILGVILGPLAERYFLTSLANYDNNMFDFRTATDQRHHPRHVRRVHRLGDPAGPGQEVPATQGCPAVIARPLFDLLLRSARPSKSVPFTPFDAADPDFVSFVAFPIELSCHQG
jgi:hypothetical protein